MKALIDHVTLNETEFLQQLYINLLTSRNNTAKKLSLKKKITDLTICLYVYKYTSEFHTKDKSKLDQTTLKLLEKHIFIKCISDGFILRCLGHNIQLIKDI